MKKKRRRGFIHTKEGRRKAICSILTGGRGALFFLIASGRRVKEMRKPLFLLEKG